MTIRVAYIGDSPYLHTGFGNVANSILRGLGDDFEIHVLGTMQEFVPQDISPFESFTPVCRHDMMGFGGTMDFVKRVNPDVCFFIGDPGTLRNRFNTFLGSGRMGILPFVTYFPIEGAPLNPAFRDQAQMVALPVTYTKWGQNLLKEYGVDADYVWHGFDHADFREYDQEEKERLRRIVGWEDKFVIGMVGVNKRVNRQPVMIETARILKGKGYNNFVMYLHCGQKGESAPLAGWELGWMIKAHDVEDCVVLKPEVGDHPNIGRPPEINREERMLLPLTPKEARENLGNLSFIDILNLFDLYVDPASAHGFNLPAGEAARCGVPITMVNDGYARTEIYEDVAQMISPTAYDHWHTGAHLPLVSPKVLADAIEQMMNNHEYRIEVAKRCKTKFDTIKWDDAVRLFTEKLEIAHEFGKEIAMAL